MNTCWLSIKFLWRETSLTLREAFSMSGFPKLINCYSLDFVIIKNKWSFVRPSCTYVQTHFILIKRHGLCRHGRLFRSPEHNVLLVSFCDHLLWGINICLVNTLETTFIVRSSWNLVRRFVSMKSWTSSKIVTITMSFVDSSDRYEEWQSWQEVRRIIARN